LTAAAALVPLLAATTSSSVAGSTPALTPRAAASEVIAIAHADIRLLITLTLWPWPGRSPTTKIVDPRTSSSGRARSTS
jgi:hypothetical protein